jgi:2-oxoglutarate dehydrogenase E2 component (dihydrolipoamide succinyltransferase)
MATEVIMPQLGESVVEGTVGRWLVAEGETIEEYQPLLEVETDKVNTEIPAPASGVLISVLVPEGATVSAGTVLALIGQPDEVVSEVVQSQAEAPRSQEASSIGEPRTGPATVSKPVGGNGLKREKPSGRAVITPVVARMAAQHRIDLASSDIPGTGHGGRITKKDMLAYIERLNEERLPPWERPGTGELFKPTEEAEPATPIVAGMPRGETPKPATPQSGKIVPLTSMRQAIAEHMLRSVRTSPHATTVMEADMSRVLAYRELHLAEFQEREGVKLTFTPFFIQAVVEGLKAVPEVNSSFTDQGILLHRQVNIGIAVALESGLIVPTIQDADKLSLSGLQRAVTDLAERARAGQLKPEEVQGSTFTLTNHGVSGSLFAVPIINQPNAGIVGVGAIQKRPVVLTVEGADSIAIRPMCYLTFTFDHRIIDGALADRFLARVVMELEEWH